MKKLLAFAAMMVASVGAMAAAIDDLRLAAEEGKCLESVVGELIQQQGTAQAQEIVSAAYAVLAEYSEQQRALGCSGNIGQAAIAAGADPNDILAATAAGLGAPGAGAPGNLGGLTGGTAGGGGVASPS
jgi:hypothetical protein